MEKWLKEWFKLLLLRFCVFLVVSCVFSCLYTCVHRFLEIWRSEDRRFEVEATVRIDTWYTDFRGNLPLGDDLIYLVVISVPLKNTRYWRIYWTAQTVDSCCHASDLLQICRSIFQFCAGGCVRSPPAQRNSSNDYNLWPFYPRGVYPPPPTVL